MPYRTGRGDEHLEAGGSVVDDLVRQFADPYAFLRELVQNAIDAGATRIVVRMDRAEHGAVWSVDDDGAGMTLGTIEGPLLTAFSSSKEGDVTSIGKYGVGFLSVFGMTPTLVRVVTHRAEGAHEVRLHPDQSFEIEQLPRRGGHGTLVVVEHPVPEGGDAAHEARGEAALVRWCRHAAVPIELDRPGAAGRVTRRIDRPMDLRAPVVVRAEHDGVVALVGPSAGAERLAPDGSADPPGGELAGFYNRGLTLVEATAGPHVVPGVRFKVSSSKLLHTLSRDDVKHDRERQRALDLVRRSAGRPLADALASALATAAAAASERGDHAELAPLLAAGTAHLDPSRISLPLVPGPDGRARVTTADHLRDADILATRGAGEVARELAGRGSRIVRLPADEGAAAAMARDVAALTGRSVRLTEQLATRLLPRGARELGAACDDLAETVAGVLGEAGLVVDAVRFAVAEGAVPPGVSVFVPAEVELPIAALPEHLEAFAALTGPRRALLLLAGHPAVAHAVHVADDDWNVAGSLLAQMVILEHGGRIDARSSEILLLRAAGAPA
jgi:molecular chaperone HtpG